MGVPVPDMTAADDASADTLLSTLRTIAPGERRKHATVFNYWLSIRRDRQFPPIRDLDPLEISDAGPVSMLLEMIGGGEDAEVRHIGAAIRGDVQVEKVGDSPSASLLACVASRLPVVAACREPFAFEDSFETAAGKTRCWVTLLPFSATGTWIDYVYGFVSLSTPGATVAEPEVVETPEIEEPVAEAVEPEIVEEVVEPQPEPEPEPVMELETLVEPEPVVEVEPEPEPEPAPPVETAGKAGFSKKFFESLAHVGGFYGRPTEVELDLDTARLETGEPEPAVVEDAAEAEPMELGDPAEPLELEETPEPVAFEEAPEPEPVVAEEPVAIEQPPADEPQQPEHVSELEGTLQSKLTDVRAKADEARAAKLRANAALYEGLSAAYDFALDAEEAPEEYLKLVEEQGLKIQLRSPMKPVVKLAFNGMCDDSTIQQLEAVLAWALKQDLPRGTLAERIEEEGGIGPILSGQALAA